MGELENYRDSLRHIVRPENPPDRQEADSMTLSDFEALWLYAGLVEYAAYSADSAEKEQIALGYAEFINMVVRDEEKGMLRLYAHTEAARDVLHASIYAATRSRDGQPHVAIRESLVDRINTQLL